MYLFNLRKSKTFSVCKNSIFVYENKTFLNFVSPDPSFMALQGYI